MNPQPSINTTFWFDMDGLEAARLYCSVIPDSEITHVAKPTDNTPGRQEGVPLEVYFRLGTQRFVALNGGPNCPHTPAASIQIHVDGQTELDRIWSALLADGGSEVQCGWLTDRFGLSWQIIPQQFNDLMLQADAATRERVVAQMLTMSKLDIAPLLAAADDTPTS